MLIKLREVGNSQVITVPKEFNLQTNTMYDAKKQEDGTIIFIPQIKNPFKTLANSELKMDEEFGEVELLESELK